MGFRGHYVQLSVLLQIEFISTLAECLLTIRYGKPEAVGMNKMQIIPQGTCHPMAMVVRTVNFTEVPS